MNSEKTNETRLAADWHARRRCEVVRELERAGDYEGARAALSTLWKTIGERPDLSRLQTDTQAEVLLRVGSLAGWIGSAQQITGAQEFAKDLLTESARKFAELHDTDKLAEAKTDLAVCYWREGAFDEARVLFREALRQASSTENMLRVKVNSTIVEISSGRFGEALSILRDAAPLTQSSASEGIKGRYQLQLALTLKKLGRLDDALIEYSAATMYLERAGHIRYVARVENNIGSVLLELDRYAEATVHLDRARSIFIQLRDAGSVAQVNETRARVSIARQDYGAAEKAAFAAISTFEQGDERPLLAEALTTHAISLSRQGKQLDSRRSFERAIEVAIAADDTYSAGTAMLIMIEELHNVLPRAETIKLLIDADGLLGETMNSETLRRYRKSTRLVLASNPTESAGAEDLLMGGSLEAELLHFEGRLIKRALDQENGSITRAARSLGLKSHQTLAFILNTRHKHLLRYRTPPRVRRKSIIKKH